MDDAPSNFVSLLAEARHGDRAAIEQLIELYEPQLRAVARVRLGPALRPFLDSVDLVQSVHCSIMIGLREDRFDVSSPQHLVALALTLVQRKVARLWRRLQRQKRLQAGGSSGDLVEQLSFVSTPSEDPAQTASFNDQVRHLYTGLNETDRRLVDLRLQGFSTVEAARALNADPHLLRVRLSRLRERLRASGLLTEWL